MQSTVFRSELREQLKEQLNQIENPRHVFARSFEESKKLAEEEHQRSLQDKEAHGKKREFLTQFRDDNKMVRKLYVCTC